VLLAKEEAVLQGMIERLIEIGRCYGMEKNEEKTKVTRIPRPPFPIQITIDQKLDNVEYFNYLGSMITNDESCTHEIKSRTVMTKAAFNKKKALCTSKLGLNLRKKLSNCEIWSIVPYGAETKKLRKVAHKYLNSFEVCAGERRGRSVRLIMLEMKKYYLAFREDRNILKRIKRRKN